VLWAGWLLPQVLLLGPALIGRTVDLPVDFLAIPHMYLPNRPEYSGIKVHHGSDLLDLLVGTATVREFAAHEIRAGRMPLWQPANFAGAPFADWPKYSPFELPYYVAPYPVTLAWIALAQAITVGSGMWLLLTRSFKLSYWPAALASWCVPFTGFMTLWHGFVPVGLYCWLPWSLLAVQGAVANPRGWSTLAVAVVTALLLLSGNPGVSGLVLITTGLFVLWLLGDAIRARRPWTAVASSAIGIGVAWTLGFLLAAPYYVPLLEYGRTGARMESRAKGIEERPPQGIEALPAIVLPEVYGTLTRANGVRTVALNTLESSSTAYAGLLAALWLAPLAWCDRRRRSETLFLTLLVIVTLGWTLNVPGLVHLLRSAPLRPLAALPYNRWTLATSVSILILAAIGLEYLLSVEYLRSATAKFRGWFSIPLAVIAGFGCWCCYHWLQLPALPDLSPLAVCYALGVGLSVAALAGWGLTIFPIPSAKWIRVVLVCLLPLELFWFAWNERRQADSALYFPRIPVLEKLATLPPGRVWGVDCLPANLNQAVGLEDVRGYDGVDPRNYVDLFELAFDHERTHTFFHARTQYALPAVQQTRQGAKLHPVSDLLNVRYLIFDVRYVLFRERPRTEFPILFHEDDYLIAENPGALPRATVPRSVQTVRDDKDALARMARLDFDPRQTAFVTEDLSLPGVMQGTVSVRYNTPTRADLEVDMQTPGLVVLSDLWDPGWRAELDDRACPIERVDVALRGFRVPAGKHTIVCAYDPQSVRVGFQAATIGGCLLLAWTIWKVVRAARRPAHLAAQNAS
jgi:hypothetical protein